MGYLVLITSNPELPSSLVPPPPFFFTFSTHSPPRYEWEEAFTEVISVVLGESLDGGGRGVLHGDKTKLWLRTVCGANMGYCVHAALEAFRANMGQDEKQSFMGAILNSKIIALKMSFSNLI